MRTEELFRNINYTLVGDHLDVDLITIDSRQTKPGALFICIKGLRADGHDFIPQAIELGVSAILCENIPDNLTGSQAVFVVQDSREALAKVSANFYGNAADRLKLIGVTGTNGKTSITYYMESILSEWGKKVGIIGTTGLSVCGKPLDIPFATSTTPDTIELHRIFAAMESAGAEYVVMEVTSHALALGKLIGVHFPIGIFTNLTQDHLDFHKDMDDYLAQKKKMLQQSDVVIMNMDDEAAPKLTEGLDAEILGYGIDHPCDFLSKNVTLDSSFCAFDVEINSTRESFKTLVPGRFSVYNTLAVIGASKAMGIPNDVIKSGLLKMKGVPGRFEAVPNNRDITVIVDYAHTPDALENILKAVRGFAKGRVIPVFGCGGDRDNKKRPIMGKIAGSLGDFCVVTSDNPRSEEPMSIISQIELGVKETSCPYVLIVDREEAIKYAISVANPGDVVIIAGKGHENYQEFENKRRVHFDDREMAAKYCDN